MMLSDVCLSDVCRVHPVSVLADRAWPAGLAQGCRCTLPLQAWAGAYRGGRPPTACYPRRARSALGVDIVFTLDGCLYVCMLAL